MSERFNPYSLEQAQEEAARMQEKIWNKEAKGYKEAEKLVEQDQVFESGEIKFLYNSETTDKYHVEGTRQVVDAMAPYMDHPVEIRYRKMKAENPGFNSQMTAEHRGDDYADRVNMNSDYLDQSQLHYYLIHELGHSFEEKIKNIAQKKEIEILPDRYQNDDADSDKAAEFHADLITLAILEPEKLKELDNELARNTVGVIKEIFGGKDFAELRESLTKTVNQLREEKGDKDKESEPFYYRIFEQIKEYGEKMNQFTELRKLTHEEMETAVSERVKQNPNPTEEEVLVGAFEEMIESQVRDAVFSLVKKGYTPESSGFGGEHGEIQSIDGYFEIDEDTKWKIYDLGAHVLKGKDFGLPGESEAYTYIQFKPGEANLDQIQEKWAKIIKLIPDKNELASPSISGGSEDFRQQYASDRLDIEKQVLEKRLSLEEYHPDVVKEMKARLEKLTLWQEIADEVDQIKDKLDEEIDQGIKETVVSLKALGLNTSQSCEGHEDRGTGGPYIDIESRKTVELEQQLEATENDAKKEEVQNKLRELNLQERKKLQALLDEFYEAEPNQTSSRLVITDKGLFARSRIESQFVSQREEKSPDKLKAAQEEMNKFTKFLKNKFFNQA